MNDPRVKMQPLPPEPPAEASPRSSAQSAEFQLMQRTLAQVYPEAVVAPFVFVGATDSKHYAALTPNIFRFSPMVLNGEDVGRIPRDERTHQHREFRPQSIEFYCQLMRNACE